MGQLPMHVEHTLNVCINAVLVLNGLIMTLVTLKMY